MLRASEKVTRAGCMSVGAGPLMAASPRLSDVKADGSRTKDPVSWRAHALKQWIFMLARCRNDRKLRRGGALVGVACPKEVLEATGLRLPKKGDEFFVRFCLAHVEPVAVEGAGGACGARPVRVAALCSRSGSQSLRPRFRSHAASSFKVGVAFGG